MKKDTMGLFIFESRCPCPLYLVKYVGYKVQAQSVKSQSDFGQNAKFVFLFRSSPDTKIVACEG